MCISLNTFVFALIPTEIRDKTSFHNCFMLMNYSAMKLDIYELQKRSVQLKTASTWSKLTFAGWKL